jgi:hypothetical protein
MRDRGQRRVGVEDDRDGNRPDEKSGTANSVVSRKTTSAVQVGQLHGDIRIDTAADPDEPPPADMGRKILRRTALAGGAAVVLVAFGLLLAAQIPRESHGTPAVSSSATAAASTTTGSSAAPARVPPSTGGDPIRSAQSTATTTVTTSTANSRYADPPDLTGNWLLHFKQLNFGDNGTHDYTIALSRLDDGKCGGTPPCYGGIWYSVEAKAFQGGNLVAMSSFTADGGKLVFSAVDTDENGKQTYYGTAPNDTAKPVDYTGDWSGAGGRAATFSFLRQA